MNKNDKQIIKWVVSGVAIFFLIILIIIALPFGIIPAGSRGVVFNNISGIEKGRILPEGTYFRVPFVEGITAMPVRIQATTLTKESAGASDAQLVTADITVNWHLDPGRVDQIYEILGGNLDTITSTAFTNNVQESMKAAVAHYQAIQVLPNRDKIVELTKQQLQSKVNKYHLIVDGVSYTNLDFSSDFDAAIERSKVAQQDAIAAQNKVVQAKAEADQAVAIAQGQADAQKAQQSTLTPLFIQNKLVDGLNSGQIKLPTTLILGNGQNLSQFLLDLPTVSK